MIIRKHQWFLIAPITLMLAGLWFYNTRTPGPQSEGEKWLWQQAEDAVHVEVSYGSNWGGGIWKHIAVNDPKSIRKLIYSLRCSGSLLNCKLAKRDDGIMGYNTSYFITFDFNRPERKRINLVINPSNDQDGIYFLTRRNEPGGNIIIKGWAEMNSSQFKGFVETLHSVPGNRSAGRS
jgi:hypothetical protein